MAGLQSFPMSRPPGPVFRPGIPGPPPLQGTNISQSDEQIITVYKIH